jgi:hypothetical protein
MADNAYDHLIVGSTPLSALVAGLLVREHGKRVCLVAEPFSNFGLERRFDLTVDLITRPETLLLLRRLSAETLKLIASIGKGLVDRIDPLFIAESTDAIAALGHFRHLARAQDIAVDRVTDRSVSSGDMARLRGQHLINHHRLAPALETWLDQIGVPRVPAADAELSIRKDGSALITATGFTAEASDTTLADDSAVIRCLEADAWDRSIERLPATALLAQPTKPLPQPFALWLDRGVLVKQEPRGSIAAVITGARDTAEARLASVAGRSLPLRRAGEARFEILRTVDGAPLLAHARGIKVRHLVGFGLSAAFYAPAIARHLAQRCSDDEAAWFAARGASRGNLRLNAAEFV